MARRRVHGIADAVGEVDYLVAELVCAALGGDGGTVAERRSKLAAAVEEWFGDFFRAGLREGRAIAAGTRQRRVRVGRKVVRLRGAKLVKTY
jgi:hypothetical protein